MYPNTASILGLDKLRLHVLVLYLQRYLHDCYSRIGTMSVAAIRDPSVFSAARMTISFARVPACAPCSYERNRGTSYVEYEQWSRQGPLLTLECIYVRWQRTSL
jgi:hypothetical protein